MPTSDPVQVLLAHNRWATENLLQACQSLTTDQFHQRFEMGPGSLHDTLTHILGAMRGWGDLLAGREQQPRLEGERRSVDELLSLLNEIADDLQESCRSHADDDTVTGNRGGRDYTFTRGAVIAHIMTHGMHHRAQCLNMLRQLGTETLPASAVVEWVLAVDGQG